MDGSSARRRLELEALEDRCCPSHVHVAGDVMVIQGDNQANVVSIMDDGQGDLQASVDGQSYTASNIRMIVFQGRNGDDQFDYQANGVVTTKRILVLQLGGGDDAVNLNCSDGVSANHFKVNLHGGAGDDRVATTFGDINATNFLFLAQLGKDNDTLDAHFTGDITEAARVRFRVFGNRGDDTVNYQAQDVAVASGSRLALFYKGGKGDDTLNDNYSGVLDGVLALHAFGSQDGDQLNADMTLDAASTGSVRAGLKGNQGNDDLTLNIDDQSGSLDELLASLDGGNGSDQATNTSNVEVVRCESDTVD